MTITIISTTAQLIAALNGASVGDTIELAPGNYSGVAINSMNFIRQGKVGSSQVTIQSEFPTNQAVLTDLNIYKSQGIGLSNVVLSTATDSAAALGTSTPFNIIQCSNVTMSGLTVIGDPNGNLSNTLSGMLVEKSSAVTVANSSFSYLHEAFAQVGDSHIQVLNNTFSHIYDDGVRGGGTSNITISGNSFTDFHPDPTDPEHPDAIQFWTANTTAATYNITITNNSYTRGTGNAVQGIFMNDEVGNLSYNNVTITGNSLAGTEWNGIYVYDVHGGNIQSNNLISYSDYRSELNVLDSSVIKVENNSAGSYSYYGTSYLSLWNNLITGPIATPSNLAPQFSAQFRSFTSPAPEPQSWALMGAGFLLLGRLVRGRRRVSKRRQAMSSVSHPGQPGRIGQAHDEPAHQGFPPTRHRGRQRPGSFWRSLPLRHSRR